jgi:predicted metal-dependent phosphoesterase TrpH
LKLALSEVSLKLRDPEGISEGVYLFGPEERVVTQSTPYHPRVSSSPIRGDFHLHTNYSFDTTTTLSQVIDRCTAVGINCVAVTDHDTIEGARKLAAIAPFRVIIGQEVSTSEGHVLGLFLSERVQPRLSARETVRRIHAQGGIAIAPHPFASLAGESLGEVFAREYEIFDAVEIANSNNFIRRDDRRAARFAQEKGMRAIGGSDSHRPNGIGSNIVEMDNFRTPEDFLGALHSARIHNVLHPLSYYIEMGFWTAVQMAGLQPRSPEEALEWQRRGASRSRFGGWKGIPLPLRRKIAFHALTEESPERAIQE